MKQKIAYTIFSIENRTLKKFIHLALYTIIITTNTNGSFAIYKHLNNIFTLNRRLMKQFKRGYSDYFIYTFPCTTPELLNVQILEYCKFFFPLHNIIHPFWKHQQTFKMKITDNFNLQECYIAVMGDLSSSSSVMKRNEPKLRTHHRYLENNNRFKLKYVFENAMEYFSSCGSDYFNNFPQLTAHLLYSKLF